MRSSLLIAAALAIPAAASAQRAASPLDRAAWLTGCWEGSSGARGVEERWSPARGGTMVATGRAFRADSTTSVEFVVLRAAGDTLLYDASPVGQARTVFRGVAANGPGLVFENMQHDFPQRISYRPVGADSLHARVEGPMGGEWRGIDYRMARTACRM